jgi:hypothetical protein
MTTTKLSPLPADNWVTVPRARLTELEALERQVLEAETLAQYERTDSRRQLVDCGAWIYTGDRVVVLRA